MTQIGAAAKQAQGGDAERPVVISADKTVKYETVVKVMDKLQAQRRPARRPVGADTGAK